MTDPIRNTPISAQLAHTLRGEAEKSRTGSHQAPETDERPSDAVDLGAAGSLLATAEERPPGPIRDPEQASALLGLLRDAIAGDPKAALEAHAGLSTEAATDLLTKV